MTDIKILKQSTIYNGYNQYSIYDFKIPSYKEDEDHLLIQNREMLETKDAAHVLVYADEIDSFVFCQQFRCGAYIKNKNEDPFLLECIAGAIEPGETPEETAKKEVKEEAGLTVDELTFILSAYSSPGILTEKAYLYYATVFETPQSIIGGLESENEQILTHVIDRNTVYQMMDKNLFSDCKTLLALNWFRCFDPKNI